MKVFKCFSSFLCSEHTLCYHDKHLLWIHCVSTSSIHNFATFVKQMMHSSTQVHQKKYVWDCSVFSQLNLQYTNHKNIKVHLIYLLFSLHHYLLPIHTSSCLLIGWTRIECIRARIMSSVFITSVTRRKFLLSPPLSFPQASGNPLKVNLFKSPIHSSLFH